MTENKVRPLFRKQAAIYQEQNALMYCSVFSISGPKKSALTVALSILVATLLYCMGWIKFADTEMFRGILRLDKDTVTVAPIRGGVYESVFVENGQKVTKGELLATVKSVESNSTGDDMTLKGIEFEKKRIGSVKEQLEISNFSYEALRGSLKISLLTESKKIEYLNTDFKLAEEAEALLRGEYQQSKLLESEGHGSSAETNRKLLALVGGEQKLNEVRQRILVRQSEIGKLEQQITIEELKYADRTATLKFGLAQLESDLLRKISRREFSLVAPIGGIVSSLLPDGDSTAVPGQPLLSLVPKEAKLEAIIYVSQDARGLIKEQQQVKLFYDTFPSGHFGSHLATIESINSEAIDPRLLRLTDTAITQPIFIAYADISQGVIQGERSGSPIFLRSDLQFNAEVIVGRRTILERIIAPLKRFESRVL